MDFYEFRADYAYAKKLGLATSKESPVEFYDKIVSGLIEKFSIYEVQGQKYERVDVETMNRYQALSAWEEDGRPYVKLYPAIAGMLGNTKIDILCEFVKIPFYVFEVRFPKVNNPMTEHSDYPLRSMLVATLDAATGNFGHQAMGLAPKTIAKDRQMILWLDFGETYSLSSVSAKEPVFFFLNLQLKNGTTVQECLDAAHEKGISASGYVPSPAFCKSATSIAIASTFFLNNEHELVAPDIHRRYVERWTRAKRHNDKKEIKTVLAQSRKLHHYGWTVGKEIELPQPEVVYHHRESSTTKTDGVSGWELHNSHVRSGHMRLQPFGPRDNPRYELIFIQPTVVRPDLPPKRGFVIKG